MTAIDHYLKAGVLTSLDVQLGRTLERLSGEDTPEVVLAAAMASRQVRHGHVCLDLAAWLRSDPATYGEAQDDMLPPWPGAQSVHAALTRSKQVQRAPCGAPDTNTHPLVWDETHGRLYLQRYFAHEARIVHHIQQRATPFDRPAPDPSLVDHLFAPGERDEQRTAALGALTRRFAVITGGPGTGKTSTVVRLLALYLATEPERATPPRIWLLAPTGKAAARLGESIASAVDSLPVDDHVRAAIPRSAQTIHRALGIRPGTYAPRHHADHPLDADLVVVDEASMIDLSVMRRLLDAVPGETPIVLLGDAHQLASVEAGATLGDLCEAGRRGAPALEGAVFELHHSHRYGADSGIAALAEACKHGNAETALPVLLGGRHPDVGYAPVHGDARLPAALMRETRRHYAALTRHDLDAQLAVLERFRILCAHRRGPLGVEHVNREAARALHTRADSDGDYHGRPILITENDPGLHLYNGDVGVIFRKARQSRLAAHVPSGSEPQRTVSLAHLPAHESVYAMSVHKSQGSEFDHVAIVLPARPSPVLSRELLYTAITRARKSVTLYGPQEVLEQALATRVQRASGLVDALLDG